MRDYASQFETLLGRLDSYDEGHMLNLFIWGLQPDLTRSVSLHYPQSIAKAVSLAETTELAIKGGRRPSWKSSTARNPTRAKTRKIVARVNGEDADGVEEDTGEEEAVVRWDRLGVTPEAQVETVVDKATRSIRPIGLLPVRGAWPFGP